MITTHPPACACEKCIKLRLLSQELSAFLPATLQYVLPPAKLVTTVAPAVLAPVAPSDTTIRTVKSPLCQEYIKASVAYIEILEKTLKDSPLGPPRSCLNCGKPKWGAFLCAHCQRDDAHFTLLT